METKETLESAVAVTPPELFYKLDWLEINDRVRVIVNEMRQELDSKYYRVEEVTQVALLTTQKLQQDLTDLHQAVFYNDDRKNSSNFFYKFIEDAIRVQQQFEQSTVSFESKFDQLKDQIAQIDSRTFTFQKVLSNLEVQMQEQTKTLDQFLKDQQQIREQQLKAAAIQFSELQSQMKQLSMDNNETRLLANRQETEMVYCVGQLEKVFSALQQQKAQIDKATNLSLKLDATKVSSVDYTQQYKFIEAAMHQINLDLDKKQTQIRSLESFTDRYMPVRILYLVRESLAAVFNKNQMMLYQTWERHKLKVIHDQLLKEETIPEINQIIKNTLKDINSIIEEYRQIAQDQGRNQISLITETEPKIEVVEELAVDEGTAMSPVKQPKVVREFTLRPGQLQQFEQDSDFDSEDSKQVKQRDSVNKQLLLSYITEADFCQDFDLFELASHPFQLDPQEPQLQQKDILRLFKVMYYKIGLSFKRMDLLHNQLTQQLSRHDTLYSLKGDTDSLWQQVQQLKDDKPNEDRIANIEMLLSLHDEFIQIQSVLDHSKLDVTYRAQHFQTQDLIRMRQVIHQKCEVLCERFAVQPRKVFADLLDLHQSEMLTRFQNHAHEELNRSFEYKLRSIHSGVTADRLKPVRSSVQLHPIKSQLQLQPPDQQLWSELKIVPLKVKNNISIDSSVLQKATMKVLQKRIAKSIKQASIQQSDINATFKQL